MEAMGILERRLLAAHCITVPESDFPSLAKHPFTAVICPSACMRSGAGIAPARAMMQAGVNLALGTDNVANNNSYDMFKEIQLTGKLMSLREGQPDAIPAHLLRMATLGGAGAGLGGSDRFAGSWEVRGPDRARPGGGRMGPGRRPEPVYRLGLCGQWKLCERCDGGRAMAAARQENSPRWMTWR